MFDCKPGRTWLHSLSWNPPTPAPGSATSRLQVGLLVLLCLSEGDLNCSFQKKPNQHNSWE